jgi:hypothetical protein
VCALRNPTTESSDRLMIVALEVMKMPRLASRFFFTVVAAIGVAACADQTVTPTEKGLGPTPDVARISNGTDSTQLVPTPIGWFYADCVHAVPNHGHLHLDGHVTMSDGSSYQTPACSHPGRQRRSTQDVRSPTLNGWLDTAYYATTGPYFGSLTEGTHVPAAPVGSYSSSQVLFTYPGLAHFSSVPDSSFILQPVLTYGYAHDYGGNYWTIASWRCNSGTDCNHGPVVTVNPGDSIISSASASACVNRVCTWTITYIDVTQSVRKDWVVDDSLAYTFAVGGAVEVDNVATCSQFPAKGIFFSGIALYDQNQQQVSPPWTNGVAGGLSPSCGFSVASTSATVSLYDDDGNIAVHVSGPREATEYTLVTATANVSGGVTPYTYAWTVNDTTACGNQNSCSAYLDSAGTFTSFDVTVTDAYNFTGSGGILVNACPPSGGAPSKSITQGGAPIRATKQSGSPSKSTTQGPPPPLCGP